MPQIPTSDRPRRLLSRLASASPFAAKSRNITDFYITIDDPHKQYCQGDVVSGNLRIKVVKPTRVTHIVVCLHGFVQVYKNPGSPPSDSYRANNSRIGSGRGSKTGEYFGNGFATLFEDEVVLCGDGRLGEGEYQFNFNVEFPEQELPSSISFERGTVSYMITATLTRPTTLAPTLQCDHKVYLLERIDISQLDPPRERTITLEPISRRNRAKTQAKKMVDSSDRKIVQGDPSQQTLEREQSDSLTTTSSLSLRTAVEVPQSPSPSDLSFDNSARRSQNGSHTTSRPSQRESSVTSPRPSDLDSASTAASPPTKTITATVASLSGGCLRGDNLAVKVHVNHTKHVKSLHGVIVTLYRQARVDMHPSIPLGPIEKGKERKYEDYYPKSMSGLGGLSLSGAGSNHVFRKDITQSIVPLIVDPSTLIADVTTKVHVPEETFPTISTVPGAMISFRYYVEVVIDIQGKLSSQDRNIGNLGGLASTMAQQGGDFGGVRQGMNGSGLQMIDTAAVRRDKGVVACTFEVVLGTRDSSRKGKKKVEMARERESEPQHSQGADTRAGAAQPYDGIEWRDYAASQVYHHQYHNAYTHAPDYGAYNEQNGYYGYDGYDGSQGALFTEPEYPIHPTVPMPVIEDESQLSEKERLRRAEARLLPSQPPGFDEVGPSGASDGATAPSLSEEQHNAYTQTNGHNTPPFLLIPSGTTGASTNASIATLPRTPDYERRDPFLPSTPAYEATEGRMPEYEASQVPLLKTPAYAPPESEALAATEDKRELQRRHLEMEASAPPQHETDEAGPAPPHMHEPSAPVLTAEDAFFNTGAAATDDTHADASEFSELPRYER